METLLATSTALLAGLLMTRVFKLIHLHFPDVTAFLLAGLLVGPYCLGKLGIPGLGFVSMKAVDGLSVLSNTALGFIAFAIGNEFRLSQLKATGKQATVIGIIQAVTATLMVDLALVGLHFCLGEDTLSLPAAITLGAIAAATAPAATLMVVRQYKAKGEVTDLLLGLGSDSYTDILTDGSAFFADNKKDADLIIEIMFKVLGDILMYNVYPDREAATETAAKIRKFALENRHINSVAIGRCKAAVTEFVKMISVNTNYDGACCALMIKIHEEFKR